MFWRRRPSDFSAEIESHLAMETDRLQALGMSPAAARARALREFGNATSSAERFFETSPAAVVEGLARDFRYAARVLRKNPAFTLVAVLSLALGIGANTAIFQLVDAVRLRMLPVKDPQELAQVRLTSMEKVRGSRFASNTLTYPVWDQIRGRQQGFADLFAWGATGLDLSTAGEPRQANGLAVSGGFFRALGLQPAMGRLLMEGDDRPGCGFPGAVISYAFWQREFGGRPDAIGSNLSLNRNPVQILGVAPRDFFGLEVGQSFDVALPICSMASFPGRDLTRSGTIWWLTVMGRMKPGWNLERAGAVLRSMSPAVFAASLPANYPPVSVKDYLELRLMAEPAGTGVSDLREEYSQPLWLLLAIAGMVLLIACANLANLMLARASARGREIAVRLAIGASRGRLIRQLMAESFLISLLGAVLGLAAAQGLSRLLVSLLSTQGNPVFVNLDRDWRVLAFTAALALVTGLLFGLAPALRTTRSDLGDVLKSGGRGSTAGRERFGMRRVLVVAQIGLSLVLVVGALLFSGTLRNLVTAETGFRQSGILIARAGFAAMNLPPARVPVFQQELLDRLRAIPGVEAAGDTDAVPLSGTSTTNRIWMDGAAPDQMHNCLRSHIGPGYFETLGTPLLSGRAIEARDTAAAPKVVVVNEAFARVALGGRNPVGQRLWVEATPFEPSSSYEIVGMVRNTKYEELRENFQPIVFQAKAQDPVAGSGDSFLVRSQLPMESLTAAVRGVFNEASPLIRYRFQVFQTSILDTLVQERLMASLSAAFGLLAGLLAAIGLYGVMSYLVARRRNEIGIRMALGATRREIVVMVLRESGLLLALGLVVGTLLSVLSTKAVATLLFGLEPTNARTLLTAAALLGLVALAASYLPARRAANLDPTVALREE
ncbi:MAG TPA: ABC transporter permease [Candidatus Sulfopaludibacter sp.]|jgi:predicted permease|nr:ABC transporter permease [Candidatus Sulfopaludibacter sp.]